MKTTIKETVKNIFASNKFKDALNLTRSLRGEYIAEFGTKSWNGLVSYYKSHPVTPLTIVAEPEPEMKSETGAPYFDEGFDEWNEETQSVTPEETAGDVPPVDENDSDDEEELEIENEAASEEESQEDSTPQDEKEGELEDEVEYMLYRNVGDKVEWFGHSENFRNLPIGATGRFIRMNNRGVSDGIIVATARMSLDHVNLFHRCYSTIIRTKYSWKEQLQMAATVLTYIKDAVKDFNLVPQSDTKMVDYIIKFSKKN